VARLYKFIDILGCELHTINDPEDKLPIPLINQVISIGPSKMRVESVAANSANPTVYIIRVRAVSAMIARPYQLEKGSFMRKHPN
jgi:hypothetical protein